MRKVRFSDLFDFGAKSKLKAGSGSKEGKYPFYTSSPVQSKYFENFQFQGKHLIFGTGGSPSVHYNSGQFAVSSDCIAAKPNENNELFNPKYVYYYLIGNIHVLEAGFRGAGLKHISKSYIANLSIPLPPFGYQNQIVSVLDKVTNSASLHALKIKKLEEFVESYFQSLFKEIIQRNIDSTSVPLISLVNKNDTINYGVVQPGEDYEEGVPIIRVGDILRDMTIDKSSLKKVSPRIDEKHKKSRLKGDELLIVGVGATIGKIGIVSSDLKDCNIVRATIRIRPDVKKVNKIFLAFYLKSGYTQAYIKNLIRVGGKPTLNNTQVKQIPIVIPPRDIQDKFEGVWRLVTSIKNKTIEVLDHYNILSSSIAQKSFSGDLKTNLEAFSFDDQMVDFIEKEYEKKEKLSEKERLYYEFKEAVRGYFNSRAFTFSEVKQAVTEYGLEIDYEYDLTKNREGLKDLVFKGLSSSTESKIPFLKQVFLIDENRDAEKNKDDSQIMLEINNYE